MGPFGYLAFFGILELYGREFKIEEGWKLQCSVKVLAFKLKSFGIRKVQTFLKLPQINEKWEISFDKNRVTIFIPKFIDIISESTRKKLREYEKNSGIDPDKNRNEEGYREGEGEGEGEGEVKNKNLAHLRCPYQQIIDLYHKQLSELPTVRSMTGFKDNLRARWKEEKERQNLAWWDEFFTEISKMDFLMGRVKSFKATLSWIVGPKNFDKIINGQYLSNNAGGNDDEFSKFLRKHEAAK